MAKSRKKLAKDMEEFSDNAAEQAKQEMLNQQLKIAEEISQGKHEQLIQMLKSKNDSYFTKKTFHANRLAVDICFGDFNWDSMSGNNRGFLVVNDKDEDIYRYIDGVWKDDGEPYVRQITAAVLKDKSSSHYQNEVINYVRSIYSLRVDREKLNSEISLINMNNGVYDITHNMLIPHDPKYYFLNKLNIDYSDKVDCPIIKKFFNEIHYKEDIDVVQELFGYVLLKALPLHILVLYVGGGRNGKSTELNLMKTFIGKDNTVSIPLIKLAEDVFASSSLFGKLANISGDIGANDIKDTGLLKELTGGDAAISAQHKFGHRFEFFNYAKLIYSCNQLPRFVSDDSDALWSRLIFINFPNQFVPGTKECDPDLLEKLIVPDELSGLFNWSMEGLKRLLMNKKFSYSRSWEENKKAYKKLADPVLAFADDYFEFSSDYDAMIEKESVYRKYAEWCREKKLIVLNNNFFAMKFKNAIPGIMSSRDQTGNNATFIYRYVKWKDGTPGLEKNKKSESIDNPQNTLDEHMNKELGDDSLADEYEKGGQ
jgi:putative DNA primase/helicase